MSQTSIEWTDTTWNPVRGCVKVSPGCANCYAETFAERWRGVPGHAYEQGFDLRLVPHKLTEPLTWKEPRRVFVNSMSDLFQDGVPDEYIDRVFAVMALAPEHTFQVLTKRAERMRDYMRDPARHHDVTMAMQDDKHGVAALIPANGRSYPRWPNEWPLPNVWLGVSVENQHFADERIPSLRQTPAAVRFISAEPLLGSVNLEPFLQYEPFHEHYKLGLGTSEWRGLDWVIVGGESGPGARPFDIAWGRSIVAQCKAAGVPVFVKQLGANVSWQRSRTELASGAGVECKHGYDVCPTCDAGTIQVKPRSRKGGDMAEWPSDLRVREFPASA